MKHVVIASLNPVKANATRIAFQQIFPQEEFEFATVSAPSGVSDQPMSSSETLTGAMNRSQGARQAHPDADYWVGIEGGLEEYDNGLAAFAWIYVATPSFAGKGKSASFLLPERLTSLIREGWELGHACDKLFEDMGSKMKGGAIGLLTDNALDRTDFYVQGVIMALVPIKNQSLYETQ